MSMLRTTQLTAKFGSIEGFSESKFSHREDNYTFGEESKKSSLLHIHESTPKKTSISKVYTFNNLSSSRDKNIEKYFHSYPSFQQTETTLQRNQSKYKEFQRQIYEYQLEGNKPQEKYFCFCFPVRNK